MPKMRFRLGFRRGPRWGSSRRSPRHLVGWTGDTPPRPQRLSLATCAPAQAWCPDAALGLATGLTTHQMYADDVVLLAEEEAELQLPVDEVHACSKDYGPKINTKKVKVVFKRGGYDYYRWHNHPSICT